MPCEIYQLAPQTHTQMMGYVIKIPGDSLIVIDGGTAGDADYLLYLLRRLGGNRPRVKAWFLTHPHSDHVYALYDLLQNRPEAFTLDALYLHYPERRVLEIGEPRSLPAWDGYQALRSQIGSREHILREGEHLDIDGTAWDVLYTSDPAFTRNASNNSSCVLRMTSEGVRTLFLGDLGVEAAKSCCACTGARCKAISCRWVIMGKAPCAWMCTMPSARRCACGARPNGCGITIRVAEATIRASGIFCACGRRCAAWVCAATQLRRTVPTASPWMGAALIFSARIPLPRNNKEASPCEYTACRSITSRARWALI